MTYVPSKSYFSAGQRQLPMVQSGKNAGQPGGRVMTRHVTMAPMAPLAPDDWSHGRTSGSRPTPGRSAKIARHIGGCVQCFGRLTSASLTAESRNTRPNWCNLQQPLGIPSPVPVASTWERPLAARRALARPGGPRMAGSRESPEDGEIAMYEIVNNYNPKQSTLINIMTLGDHTRTPCWLSPWGVHEPPVVGPGICLSRVCLCFSGCLFSRNMGSQI